MEPHSEDYDYEGIMREVEELECEAEAEPESWKESYDREADD